MFKCAQCGNETFYKESETISRCNACFSKIDFANSVAPSQIHSDPLRTNGNAPSSKKNRLKYAVFFSILIIYFVISQYALDFFSSSLKQADTTQLTIEPEKEILPEEEVSKDLPESDFQLESLTPLPDVIGNVYFVGYIQNIGSVPAEKPRVDIHFYDKKGKLLTSTFGYAAKNTIEPNEKSMIQILLKEAPKFDKMETKITATKLYYERKNPRIEILRSDIVNQSSGLVLTGRLKNLEDYAVQYVEISLILRDKKSRILHYSSHFLHGKTLGPSEEADFTMELYITDPGQTSHEIQTQALKKD